MKFFHALIQRISWPFFNLFARFFLRFDIQGREHIKRVSFPIIIASNHKFFLDPFFIFMQFPFFSRVFPVRFMSEGEKFNTLSLELLRKTKLIFLIYSIFGAFLSKRGEGIEKALEDSIRFLTEKKESVLMFPEGTRVYKDGLGEFHRGTAALAIKTGVPILPVIIKYKEGHKRYTCFVRFGAPISFDKTISFEKATLQLRSVMERIYDE